MNTRRALQLADFLWSQVEISRFDMIVWWRKIFGYDGGNTTCNTVGCAMGWGAQLFPKILYIDDSGMIRMHGHHFTDARSVIYAFFELGEIVYPQQKDEKAPFAFRFSEIFYPQGWINNGWLTLDRSVAMELTSYTGIITPKMVAEKIREFVSEYEAGERKAPQPLPNHEKPAPPPAPPVRRVEITEEVGELLEV